MRRLTLNTSGAHGLVGGPENRRRQGKHEWHEEEEQQILPVDQLRSRATRTAGTQQICSVRGRKACDNGDPLPAAKPGR